MLSHAFPQLLLVLSLSATQQPTANETTAASPDDLETILHQQSTSRYFMIYRRHFSNHMTHGLVALHRLGATSERLVRFAEYYGPRLSSPRSGLNVGSRLVTRDNIGEFRGKKENFYGLLWYFTQLLEHRYAGNVKALLQEEFPRMMDGMGASAAHPTIQTGYGTAGGSKRTICEGLAYLWFAHVPLSPKSTTLNFELGGGDKTITEVLREIRLDTSFRRRVELKARNYTLGGSTFKRTVSVLLTEEADVLLLYVRKLQFPTELERTVESTKWSHLVPSWVLQNALVIYTMTSPRNNFFLLHGVTGAWALGNIVPTLRQHDQETATKMFTAVSLALYVSQGAPEVTGLPPRETYEHVTWDAAIRRTMTEDLTVHVIKLVQCAKEFHDEINTEDHYLHMNGLSHELHHMCLAAASIALSSDFSRAT